MKPHHKRSAVDPEKRRQRRVLIFSIIMIGLMVFSVAEVIIYNRNPANGANQMVYGKYEFVFRDLGNGAGVLVSQINGQEVEFQNLPSQVGYLPVDPNAIALLKQGQQVGLSVNPTLSQQDAGLVDYIRLQIGLAIPKTFNAISEPDPRITLPVMNCSRATAQMPLVVFNVLNESSDAAVNTTASVITQGDCIIVSGAPRDIARLKDRMIFEYYDILSNGTVVA